MLTTCFLFNQRNWYTEFKNGSHEMEHSSPWMVLQTDETLSLVKCPRSLKLNFTDQWIFGWHPHRTGMFTSRSASYWLPDNKLSVVKWKNLNPHRSGKQMNVHHIRRFYAFWTSKLLLSIEDLKISKHESVL